MGFIREGRFQTFKKCKILTRIHGEQQIHPGAVLEYAVDGDRRNLSIHLVPKRARFVAKYDAEFPNSLIVRTSRKDFHLLHAHRLSRL